MTLEAKFAHPALLVLGAPGSRASARLASILLHVGCKALSAVVEEEDAPAPVANLNDRILAASGSAWHDWRSFPVPEPDTPEGGAFRDAAAALVATVLADAPEPIVIEDERLCRVLPVWLDALARERRQPLLIIVHESPLESARSLGRRTGLPLELGLLLWLRYMLDAERLTRGQPRAFVSHDLLRSEWREVVGTLSDRFSIMFPQDVLTAPPLEDGLLPVPQQGAAEALEAAGVHGVLLGHACRCFEVLERWGSKGENVQDYDALDRMLATLTEAGWAHVAVLDGGSMAEAQSPEPGQEHERQARELGELTRLLCAVEQELDESRSEIRALGQRVRSLGRKLDASLDKRRILALQVEDQNRRLQAAQGLREETEEQYRAVVESTSWRLTAPLRQVLTRLRGARTP